MIKLILDPDYHYFVKCILRDKQSVEQINRKTAEQIFDKKPVSDSKFYQDHNEIRITLKLADNTIIIYKFDLKSKHKTYYIEQ